MASETTFSAEEYFATQIPPPTLERDILGVRDFVKSHQASGRKVVLVTVRSGTYGRLWYLTSGF